MQRATPFDGDLRNLPQTMPKKRERPEHEPPANVPKPLNTAGTGTALPNTQTQGGAATTQSATSSVQAPGPIASFDGLDFATWGAGHPPDTNGDVGPTYYIETVNTSIGIYRKSDGSRVAAFTFDTFMSQGHFGNLCDTDNFGDPVVLYDTFEDRWVITDFAFQLDASGNVINPPGSFQCFAVSKSGDPVSGGWNFYSINTAGGLGDYPKFGIWPDGVYMSANMFDYAASGSFQNPRLYAFNKAQMYAGAPVIQVVSFDAPAAEFTLLPANARLQTGTPPAGSPNYFADVWQYLNAVSIYKFHVDWNDISLSSLSGPFNVATSTWWEQYSLSNGTDAPSPQNSLDTLYPRLMMQNQYTNLGGVESLWDSHSVGAGNPTSNLTSSQAAVRFYQLNVTGGTIAANASQNFTYSPDTTLYRYMPSVAVNKAGDMAIGYTTSNSTINPAIVYAGRLSTDAVNTISQTEQTLIQGTGSQSGNCGSSSCTRWGDYSAMSLDPDGCTFWYANEYYAANGLNDLTRIGAFRFPTCTQSSIQTGTIQGTVTVGSTPVSGATVMLGSGRSTTTDSSGNYLFSGVPAGTYPSMSASYPGLNAGSATNVVVTGGNTTTQNFSLTVAPASGCLTDTLQSDFQAGIPTNCDLVSSPGNVVLTNAPAADQKNLTVTSNGFGFSTTAWAGQTFTPSVTGKLTRVDLDLFCSGCTSTTSNITVSIRATSGGVPTGSDLAVTTIPAFTSGSGGYFTASFATPATVTAGTRYAIVFRDASSFSTGTYAYVCSCTTNSNPYANGQRVTSSNSGTSWSADTTSGGRDLGFVTYIQSGYSTSGTFVSSVKDANPAPGASPAWNTISWNATVPANTTLKFQAAGSNNPTGPYTFVGPDGTANTFFTSGGSLAQFNGKRYLRYQAAFTTSDTTKTPTLNDVTVCFTNSVPSTSTAVAAASGAYSGTTTLSATLTSGATGVTGKTIAFTLGGNSVGSAVTNSSGVATVSNVSLTGFNAGSYANSVGASFAGDANYGASSGSNNLTVNPAIQTISFAALANKTFGDPDFTVSATATSGLSVSFAASGQCTVSGNLVHLTASGSCTITASQAGNSNYNAAPNVPQSFTIAAAVAGPSAISVTPNSGTGASQTFSFAFSDGSGYQTLWNTQMMFNTGTDYAHACAVYYNQPNNQLYLMGDQGTTWLGPKTLGTTGTLQNSQCTLDVGASSASGSGNTLTVNAALTFASSFVGAKNIYLDAMDTLAADTGWQNRGTWTPYAAVSQAPSAVSVSPNSGTGTSQTFALTYSDANGYQYLWNTQMLINAGTDYAHGCATYYYQPNNQLYLMDDTGTTWLGPKTVGVAGTLQNSQCTLDVGASSVSGAGNTLIVNVALSFKSTFVGAKTLYLYALDLSNTETGWQNRGTWTAYASVNQPPSAVSVTPNAGSGTTQTFTATYSDANGYQYLWNTQMMFNNGTDYSHSCATYYNQANNQIFLMSDQGTTWLGPKTPGTPGTLQNSQCTLDAGASSASGSGNTLTVNVALSFNSSFVGSKTIFLYALDTAGLDTGWQSRGSWTAYGSTNQPPTAVSVTPSSGTGSSQTFSFVYSDVNGYQYLWNTQTMFNVGTDLANSCATYYNQPNNQIYLINDQGTTWLGPKIMGSPGTLANTQCTLDAGASSASGSGNTLTVNVALTFNSSFSGTKTIYMYALDVANLDTGGWQSRGTWTAP